MAFQVIGALVHASHGNPIKKSNELEKQKLERIMKMKAQVWGDQDQCIECGTLSLGP